MDITRPKFSTIVEPSEYPIEKQFDAMVRDANKHKEGFVSMDVGKVVGLLQDWQALTARLQEAERLLEYVLECPYIVDDATVARAGIKAAPEQVVINFSFAWMRREQIAAFLAAK